MIKKEDISGTDVSCEFPMVINKLEVLKDLLMQFEDPAGFYCNMIHGVGMILSDSVDDLKTIIAGVSH